MLRKRESPEFDQVNTFIGKDANFQGVLKTTSALRIDGSLEGEIQGEGDILVGETGKVEGNINGRNVLVAGLVKGNIQARGKIELAATGQIFGDIQGQNLVVDEGALFQGNCQMVNAKEQKNVQKTSQEG